jgi:hypothetical protein
VEAFKRSFNPVKYNCQTNHKGHQLPTELIMALPGILWWGPLLLPGSYVLVLLLAITPFAQRE